VKRFLLFVTLAAIASGAAAPSAKRPAIVPAGVSIGGIKIGGLTAEQARSGVDWWYNRRVHFAFHGRHWAVRPTALGARVDLDDATERALKARPGRRLTLRVDIDQRQVRRYIRALDARFSFPAEDATVELAGLQPVIRPGKAGLKLSASITQRRINAVLAVAIRPVVRPVARWVAPTVTSSDFGPVIVIHRGSNQMFVYDRERPWHTFPIATGQAIYPTPLGSWHIVDMQRNPWWRPPHSAWARGLQPIPPGPGNPLGTRWMGLDAAGVGMHGTPDAASIGYSASHGCIRMQIPDAEWLFDQVHIGTPVFIVSA
jgi:lipoprotein-anchoring transpeptidase ErfK/SrfK